MTAQRTAISLFVFLVFLFHTTTGAVAADCTIDSDNIDRGELKQFFICSPEITSDYMLRGLSESRISIDYQQHVQRCAPDDNRPGIFLWLQAQEDAETASLGISRRDTNELICDELIIDVPDRIVLNETTLTAPADTASRIHLLEITADASQDLSQACDKGLTFPDWGRRPSRWPLLSLVSEAEMPRVPLEFQDMSAPLICEKSSIKALVVVDGQQRDPAKVVISDVGLDSGRQVEGVAMVSLPEPPWASSMQDDDAKFIDINGIRTRYFEKGEGDALLLLHGGQPTGKAGGALAWTHNFDGLAKKFHVYALDRLGQGRTDNPKTESDYEHYYERLVEHVYDFIKAVGIEKVHLVGHSQGGWPVTRLALSYPELVSCVVNVDSVMAPGKTQRQTARYYMFATQFVHPPSGETAHSVRRTRELQSHTLNNITLAGARRGLELAQLPKLKEADAQFQKIQMTPRHPVFQALREAALQEIGDGKLKVPSLLIWGYNDPSSPLEGGLELFDLINAGTTRESHMHVFNKSGHSSYIEYPDEFNRVIESFCGRY